MMNLLDDEIREKLLENGRIRAICASKAYPDFFPLVRLFTPDAGYAWLLTDLNPENPDEAYGLCDLSVGCPEMGKVLISELETMRGKLGQRVERDRYFAPVKTISAYAAEARERGCIV